MLCGEVSKGEEIAWAEGVGGWYNRCGRQCLLAGSRSSAIQCKEDRRCSVFKEVWLVTKSTEEQELETYHVFPFSLWPQT